MVKALHPLTNAMRGQARKNSFKLKIYGHGDLKTNSAQRGRVVKNYKNKNTSHITCDMRHVVGSKHSLKTSALKLLRLGSRDFFEDWEEKDGFIN